MKLPFGLNKKNIPEDAAPLEPEEEFPMEPGENVPYKSAPMDMPGYSGPELDPLDTLPAPRQGGFDPSLKQAIDADPFAEELAQEGQEQFAAPPLPEAPPFAEPAAPPEPDDPFSVPPVDPESDFETPEPYQQPPEEEEPFPTTITSGKPFNPAEVFTPKQTGPTPSQIETAVQEAVQQVREEMEVRMKELVDEVSELRKVDEQIQKVVKSLQAVEKRYEQLEEKVGTLPEESEQDLKDVKATVNNLNNILSAGLPALIKEVRDMKGTQ